MTMLPSAAFAAQPTTYRDPAEHWMNAGSRTNELDINAVVSHETFYCHCSETLVTEGTVVRAGEAVARVGATGWATGPHLHFEIRKNGTKLDPLQILERDA